MTTPYDQHGHALDPPDELMKPSTKDWRVEVDLAMTAAHMLLTEPGGHGARLTLGDFNRMARVLFYLRRQVREQGPTKSDLAAPKDSAQDKLDKVTR